MINLRVLTEFGEINNQNNNVNIIFQDEHITVQPSVFKWIDSMLNIGSISNALKFVYNFNTFETSYKLVDETDPHFDVCFMYINFGPGVELNKVLHAFTIFQDTIQLNELIESDVTIDLRDLPKNDNN